MKQEIVLFKKNFDEKLRAYLENKIFIEKDNLMKDYWEDIKNYVLSGGKRLRPFILNKLNKEFAKRKDIDKMLIAFELLHNSTLIEDDIIDEHRIIRNKETISSKMGNYKALMMANILRDEGFKLIISSKSKKEGFIDAYLDITNSINKAQLMDLHFRKDFSISEKDYIKIVELVAARFIAWMFKLGAKKECEKEFFIMGENIGIIFQLADDIMDVDSDKKKGRPIGSDIMEGVATLLSINAYRKLNSKDKKRFVKIYGNKNVNEGELYWIINKYKEKNLIKYSKHKINNYLEEIEKISTKTKIQKDHWINILAKYSIKRIN